MGALFFYKYGSRISDYVFLLFLPYLAILYLYFFRLNGSLFNEKMSQYVLILSNILLVIGSGVVFTYVDVLDLDVDRWSVITHYWDYFFDGKYPYTSSSHMGNFPGPYPFYYIIALPFYLLGEIGWMPIAGILLLQVLTHWQYKSWQINLTVFILSMASIGLPYEILTRSTLFFFSVLVLMALDYSLKTWFGQTRWQVLLIAFLIGLLTCTRPVYGLVFLIGGIYAFRKNFDSTMLWLSIVSSALGLVLPFLHLYLLFPDLFFEFNPVTFMTENFVPTWFYVVYLLVAVGMGWIVKSRDAIIFYAGAFLMFVVACYAILQVYHHGWYDAIFNHHIDITYFIMALPFLIAALAQHLAKKSPILTDPEVIH